MLNPLVCGTFHHQKEDETCLASPCSSPRKSKRKDSRNNNPYSTRGLDKFSALLADLDEKRQKVYSQMNPQDISLVRFAYSSTDDFVPIVVKVKNKDPKHKTEEHKLRHLKSISEPILDKSATAHQFTATVEETKQPKMESDHDKNASKNSFSWKMKWDMWRRPSFYLPVVMILILMFLIVFGRSVATLCTCIMWYIIPTLQDDSSKPSKLMKKKDYVRRLSEKKMVTEEMKKKDHVRGLSEKKMVTEGLLSPRSGNSRASMDKYSGKHGHQKSW